MQKLGLDRKLMAEIVGLIKSYKEPEQIYLFGSRAQDGFSNASENTPDGVKYQINKTKWLQGVIVVLCGYSV